VIIDGVWDIGSCAPLAQRWTGVVDPLCKGVAADLQVLSGTT